MTDGPAPTLFRRYVDVLRDEVLRDLPDDVVEQSDAVASHVWDASPADNLVLRVLAPSRSSLTPSRDYLGGRTAEQVMLAALDTTVAGLVADHGPDPASWRDQHPRRPVKSLTGVIGPSLTMPYQDRGSWVHVVAFTAAQAPSPSRPVAAAPVRTLPATGAGSLPALAALVLLAGLAGARTRRS